MAWTALQSMASSMQKSNAACTDSHKLAFLPINSSNAELEPMAIFPYRSRPDYGNMTPETLIFLWLLMILASNIPIIVQHLMTTLKTVGYKVSKDWTSTRYCGLTIAWDYIARTFTISMPGYVERALQRLQHTAPKCMEDSPHKWNEPHYGFKIQFSEAPDTTPFLNAANKRHVQEVLGTFLFYARAVYIAMLKAIGTIATQQSTPTQATLHAVVKLLNYAASHPDAELQFKASDMVLWIDSDASYLSETKSRFTCTSYHFFIRPTK
jgi:hypothetical protein